MLMETQNDQTSQPSHQGMSVLVARVAGLIAGAASVTALALSDEDIRKRVSKKAKELKSTLQDWSTEKLQMVDHHKTVKEDTVKKVEKVVGETNEEEPLKEVKMNN
jgi:hypothetical protein